MDLGIHVPETPLGAVCTHEQWGQIDSALAHAIQQHRSTLIFVNTRRLAERLTRRLAEHLGEDAVACHHGSLARHTRLDAEKRLKEDSLQAIVATASLELGIDIGAIDLVAQIGSPRAIATFVQRAGRAGHTLGRTPKARLFPLTRDELLESIALLRAVREGTLDAIESP
jgi:ATP-dependent Lhr-like helicase